MGDTNIAQDNLAILKIYYPELRDKIDGFKDGEEVSLIPALSGDMTCKVRRKERDILLHSRYDPKREAIHLIDSCDTSKSCMWILLGMGLGYPLFELLDRVSPGNPILVFEKKIELFRASLSIFDWTHILPKRELRLIIGEEIEEIDDGIEERIKIHYWKYLLQRDIQVVRYPPSMSLSPSYYKEIENVISRPRLYFLADRIEIFKNVRLVDRLILDLRDIMLRRGEVDQRDNIREEECRYTKGLVSIIIPTHNRLDILREVLTALYEYTTYHPTEVIIWDNDSNEETKRYLEKISLNPKIPTKVILHNANIGKNCLNECIRRYAKGEYIVVMDSDIIVSPNWLEGMVRAVETVPKAGYLTANMNAGKFEDRYYRKVNYNGIIIQEGPTGGACTIIRRDVYRDIGEFLEMEGHTYICEDGNYSHRARKKVMWLGIFKM